MNQWKIPEIIELDAVYTEGSSHGTGEDHIKVENNLGWDIWGSNPS